MSHRDAKYFLDYDAVNAIVWDRYAVEEAKGYLILLNDPSININVIVDGNVINFLFGYKLKNNNYNESHVRVVKTYISTLNDDVDDNNDNISKRNSLIFFYCYVLRSIIKYHNYLLNPCYSCYYYWTMKQLLYNNIEEYFNHLSKSLENI